MGCDFGVIHLAFEDGAAEHLPHVSMLRFNDAALMLNFATVFDGELGPRE